MTDTTAIGTLLREKRASGRKLFIPYVTAGFPGVDAALLRELQAAGADAIEVGVPFSDPIMDGGVIQHASEVALAAGFHVADAFHLVDEAALDIPVLLMTYVNPIFAMGEAEWIAAAKRAGVGGFIVPDLPVDEGQRFASACAAEGLALVFLAAPGAAHERLATIASASTGFVYCVATYGVTGAREALSMTAESLLDALRPLTDGVLLVGVGISTPQQASEAAAFADGVIVGSALVRSIGEDGPQEAVELAAAFRAALDGD